MQMTKVMPIASTPNTDVDSRMLRTLETERKSVRQRRHHRAKHGEDDQRFEANRRAAGDALAPGSARRRRRCWRTWALSASAEPGRMRAARSAHQRQTGAPARSRLRGYFTYCSIGSFFGFDHVLGQHEGRHVGHFRDLLAGEHLLDALDRLHADEVRQLGDRGVEAPGLDRFDRVGVAVDADDDDLVLAGGARRLDRAQRHVVVGAEDRNQIRIALQRVVGDVGGFQTVPVAGQRRDDGEARRGLLQLRANPRARFWPVMLPDRPSITSTGPLASLPSTLTR